MRVDVPNAQTATEVIEVENGQPASKRPKQTSDVWEHFTKIKDKNSGITKAVCKYCKYVFSAPSKNATSHLRRHLDIGIL
ncbi:hypothetical protein M5689_000817 [Euphorbia peplus]|nr:hypothetical protein M5689_000817 [Euphorbia peplus]